MRDSLRAAGQDPEQTVRGYNRKPELINRAQAAAALERHYPKALRQAARGGTLALWAYIDPHGVVRATEITRSSGLLELDRAAVLAMEEFRFSPAVGDGCRVGVWIEFPVTFEVQSEVKQTG